MGNVLRCRVLLSDMRAFVGRDDNFWPSRGPIGQSLGQTAFSSGHFLNGESDSVAAPVHTVLTGSDWAFIRLNQRATELHVLTQMTNGTGLWT